MTAREFDLLAYLARHPRQAFTREELLERVWGYTFGDTATVTVHVRRLREKIEADPSEPRAAGDRVGRGVPMGRLRRAVGLAVSMLVGAFARRGGAGRGTVDVGADARAS